MNNQRYHRQNNRYQQDNRNNSSNNRSQYTTYRAPSRKDQLERELGSLERELVALDVQIDALGQRGRLLDAEKSAHMQSIPGAITQVALSTLGVKYLPPVARGWYYKHQQLLRAEANLKQYAVSLYTKREAVTAQVEMVQVQIEMLQFEP